MSAQGYSNQEFADEAHQDLRKQNAERRDQLAEHEGTRAGLESPGGPTPADGAPATAAEADTDGGTEAFVMSEDRRVGSMTVPVDGHGNVRFGKPSGRASMQIMGPIEDSDEGGDPLELGTYVWRTLAEWALDDEFADADKWADEMAFIDAIQTLRTVGLGGNVEQP